MLPTFLGIGTPRAGTTWVSGLLAGHPDVVAPAHRKEIHYFDLHYDRGVDWYERFFPPGDDTTVAAGEFTPHYLYDARVPQRVRSVPTIERFLVLIRNPVDRAYSHFRFRRRQDNRTETFEEFLRREPTALAWGHYAEHLAEWFAVFGRESFLVLVFEEAVADPDGTKRRLADHLGLEVERFADRAGFEPVNAGVQPRRRRVYAGAVRQARWLRRHDLDRVITLAKRSGVVAALKKPRPVTEEEGEAVPAEVRERLWKEFEPDVSRLEDLAGLDLSGWRARARA